MSSYRRAFAPVMGQRHVNGCIVAVDALAFWLLMAGARPAENRPHVCFVVTRWGELGMARNMVLRYGSTSGMLIGSYPTSSRPFLSSFPDFFFGKIVAKVWQGPKTGHTPTSIGGVTGNNVSERFFGIGPPAINRPNARVFTAQTQGACAAYALHMGVYTHTSFG